MPELRDAEPGAACRVRIAAVRAMPPPDPWIVEADEQTFAQVIEGTPLPVLVDLWAPWCGPCRIVGPALEQLTGDLAGRVKLVKVNVDKAPSVQGRFAVRGIPTLVLLRDGREVSRRVGAAPLADLRSWLEPALGSAPVGQS